MRSAKRIWQAEQCRPDRCRYYASFVAHFTRGKIASAGQVRMPPTSLVHGVHARIPFLSGESAGVLRESFIQASVDPIVSNQFVVGSAFDDFSMVQHQDLIGISDGADSARELGQMRKA